MSSSTNTQAPSSADGQEQPQQDAFIEASDTLEEINPEEGDHPMMDDDDDEGGEGDAAAEGQVDMLADSSRFFDSHSQSIFSIARHPKLPEIIATGGGDDLAYIWSSSSDSEEGNSSNEPKSQAVLFKLEGHKDSITALEFTATGELLVAGGMDGRISVVRSTSADGKKWEKLAHVHEVDEINWVLAHPTDGTCFAAGTNEGSVWVYAVNPAAETEQLAIRHVFYPHKGSCTAGAWAQGGNLLVTVSDDGTLFAHDINTAEVKLSFTSEDQRFAVDGGLYSVAVNAAGTVAVAGGATGECKVVSLPGAGAPAAAAGSSSSSSSSGKKTSGGGKKSSAQASSGGIVATLAAQKESVETLTFSPTLPLLAAGSVDGTIVLYETGRWAVRRTIEAHQHAVVKVEFVRDSEWDLLSCSTDGSLRKWDCRTGDAKGVWKGHADDSEGIMGFAQSKDATVVTAGDDGVALIFQATETSKP